MPGGKDPGPSIKKPDSYEALKEKGFSKSKAAAISNAQAQGKSRRHAMGVEAAKTAESSKKKPITKGGEAKPQKATKGFNKPENR
jgi:hypothetical protein